jgi:hypothetical protein
MINPELERFMAGRTKSMTVELTGNRAAYVLRAKEVAALIEKAANAAEQTRAPACVMPSPAMHSRVTQPAPFCARTK